MKIWLRYEQEKKCQLSFFSFALAGRKISSASKETISQTSYRFASSNKRVNYGVKSVKRQIHFLASQGPILKTPGSVIEICNYETVNEPAQTITGLLEKFSIAEHC